MKSISVFCGSSNGNDEVIIRESYGLGKLLAHEHITLVYGGAKVGLMGQVANGVLDHQGKVVGVIPDFLSSKEIFHDKISELIVVDSMQERKMKMHELSEGTIALPGGFGTLEELFEMVTWAQLGLHAKPIGILNINGYYDKLLEFLDGMVVTGLLKQENRDMLLVDGTSDGLLGQMKSYRPTATPKWIKKDQI
ncbi:TIGR00730 family Rossman fold protein [Flagellimonas sp.]|uniref:LOG family protein n=1 Tax=Flagellimonas sp. TaxID=2058762 RepID=UPI003BA97625